MKLTILTAGDFPYGMAMESFVRQLSFGLYWNNADVEIIRLFGNRLNETNDTNIKCSNYLFTKPVKKDLFKFFEIFTQFLFIPIFIIYRKLIKKDDALIMYGLDRAYLVFPLTIFAKLVNLGIYRFNTEIYAVHTYAYKWWRMPLILFNKLQLKYFDRYLDGVIVLSYYLKKLEITNGVEYTNILLIPHFICVDIEKNDHEDTVSINTIKIGFCGTPSIENGIIDLIDAFSIFNLSDYKNC